jgi:hypothetical protein
MQHLTKSKVAVQKVCMSHDLGQNGKDFTYPIIFTKGLLQAISHT